MLYLTIKTNTKLPSEKRKKLLKDASQTVSISYKYCASMIFAGSDAPLTYLELKSIGLPESKTPNLSNALSQLLGHHLNVPANRVYIEFSATECHLWGSNSSTFWFCVATAENSHRYQ